jgi:hypothetical protein
MSARWIVFGLVSSVVVACSSSPDQSTIGGTGTGTGGGPVFVGNSGGASGASGSNGAAASGNGATTSAGATSGAGATTSGAGAPNGGGGAPPNACGAFSDSTGCTGSQYAGENLPLDIYIMFDQSGSMSCPADRTGAGLNCINENVPSRRIDDVRSAVVQFLQDPASQGIGVGIGYFGYMQAGSTSCDPSAYSMPGVTIAPLPGNAQAIIDNLNSKTPTGETPTGPAIRGACTYAYQWQNQNPSHITVVLLVTDGFPEAPVTSQNGGCTPTIDDAVQAATTCATLNPPLNVFVVGVGRQLTNLNDIAVAGGTQQAYLVGGTDVSGQVLQALNTIRATAQIPCALRIPSAPSGQTIQYNKVNVSYCNASRQSITFLNVENSAGCDSQNGGWYYDDPAAPTQIQLCEASCNTVSAPGGSLLTTLGCDTQISIH